MVISLPADLEQQVAALTETGGYASVETLLRDALGVLLAVKLSGLLDTAAMTDVVLALEREDGYGFRGDVRTALPA